MKSKLSNVNRGNLKNFHFFFKTMNFFRSKGSILNSAAPFLRGCDTVSHIFGVEHSREANRVNNPDIL